MPKRFETWPHWGRTWRQKLLSPSLVAIAAIALVASACASDSNEAEAPTEEPESEIEEEASEEDASEVEEEASEEDAPPSEESSLDSLIDAAVEEGQLRVDTVMQEVEFLLYLETFQEAYPEIEVTYRRADTGPMRALEEEELGAEDPQFDVVFSAALGHLLSWDELGLMADLSDIPGYQDAPEPWQQGHAITWFSTPPAMMYNTDNVTDDEVPTSFEDLLDDRWAGGRIGIADPTLSGTQQTLHFHRYTQNGLEYYERLGELEPRLYDGDVALAGALAAGEVDITVGVATALHVRNYNESAPTAAVALDDTVSVGIQLGLIEAAENPNAGKLFIHHLITSQEVDEILVANGKLGPVSHDPDRALGDVHPALGELTVAQLDDPDPVQIMNEAPDVLPVVADLLGF